MSFKQWFSCLAGVFLIVAGAGNAVVAAPQIESLKGDLEEGSTIVLRGSGFSEKASPRPLFVWDADSGLEPRSVGRKSNWAGPLNGELSTAVVADGSERAFRFDHGSSSGAALAGVKFDSDRLFVYRRTYEDFDLSEDYAIRTRVDNISGEIKVGQTVTGSESGATGVIASVGDDANGRKSIFYTKSGGTVNHHDPVDFVYGEEMTTDTATFTNSEGTSNYPTGTYRTFNFKTYRMWNEAGINNIYVGAGQKKKFNIMPEHTGAMFWNDDMDVALRQEPMEWKSEQIIYQASGVDTQDGILDFRQNNVKRYDHNFTMRDGSHPNRYDIVYQSQVSNGAQPGSFIYYDHLYIDDSWHRVLLCEASTWKNCGDAAIQIPLEWSNGELSFELNYRHLDPKSELYLYVADSEGTVNSNGFDLCADCPREPQRVRVD